MKVDRSDLGQVDNALASLRVTALDNLEAAVLYLESSPDFKDRRKHIAVASSIGLVLAGLAGMQLWTAWGEAIEKVVDEKGEAADTADVNAILTAALLARTTGIGSTPSASPLSAVYSLLVTEQYSNAIKCNQDLATADSILQSLAAEAGAVLGLTGAEVIERLKNADEEACAAVEKIAETKVVERLRANGVDPAPTIEAMHRLKKSFSEQHGVPERVAGAGTAVGGLAMAGEKLPGGHSDLPANALRGLGLLPDEDAGLDGERTIPRYPSAPRHFGQRPAAE